MVEENKEVQKEPEVDLVTKVSGYKAEPKKEPDPNEIASFDYKELESIENPEQAKAWAEKAYKSMQGDYGRKTQSLAEQRKDLERKMTESNQWTPTRVQELLDDKDFLASAQSVMAQQNPSNSGKSDEEWSTLTDNEKQKFVDMQTEIIRLKQQNQQTSNTQQDELLKGKYSNYDAQAVEKLKDDLRHNRVMATNEHLWKLIDYKPAIERAFELGKKTEREFKREKIDGMTYTPDTANVVKEALLKTDGDKLPSLAQLYNHTKKQTDDNQLRE